MKLTDKQKEEFEKLARPLIKFLNDNCYPHVTVIIGTNRVEMMEGVLGRKIDDYIKD